MGFNRISRIYLTLFIPYLVEKERIHCGKKEFFHKEKKKYLLQTDNKNKQKNHDFLKHLRWHPEGRERSVWAVLKDWIVIQIYLFYYLCSKQENPSHVRNPEILTYNKYANIGVILGKGIEGDLKRRNNIFTVSLFPITVKVIIPVKEL